MQLFRKLKIELRLDLPRKKSAWFFVELYFRSFDTVGHLGAVLFDESNKKRRANVRD